MPDTISAKCERLLTCVYSNVVLVIGGRCKRATAVLGGAKVGSLTSVGPDVNLADVRCGERPLTAHKRTLEWSLTWHCTPDVTHIAVTIHNNNT